MRCVHAEFAAPVLGESCTVRVVQSNDIKKFDRLATPVIGERRSGLLLAAVERFDTTASVSEVLELATQDRVRTTGV
jgi:hypothetical protein